jgi:hypothetical protein
MSLRLLLALSIICTSCASTGPRVAVYLSDPQRGGMEFFDPRTGLKGSVPYSETEKFMCLKPSDMQELLNFCKNR